jgi:hypothetical protein
MKNKNKSKTIKNGTTLQTRDEFLYSGKDYAGKPGYESRGLYRRVVVVDSEKTDNLAVVKLLGADKAGKPKKNKVTPLPHYQKGGSVFRPFIETHDNTNNPIRIGEKFTRNRTKHNMSKHDTNSIKIACFRKAPKSIRKDNRKKAQRMKKRSP